MLPSPSRRLVFLRQEWIAKHFSATKKTIDAVARNLEVIGEAVRQLPDGFKNTHPDIPWSQIGGMRNRIVHEYFRLDMKIIWQIVHEDLPDLGGAPRSLNLKICAARLLTKQRTKMRPRVLNSVLWPSV